MSLYKPPESENWWIDIRHAGQRIRRTSGTTSREAAQEYHDSVKAELWRQERVGDKPEYTWNAAVKRWIEEHDGKASLSDDKDKLRWLSKHLSSVNISTINADKIERLIKLRREEPAGGGNKRAVTYLSLSTINRYMSALSAVLNSAVRWEWIDAAPKIRKLPEPNKRIAYLTSEEANILIAELPMHLAEMAAFTLATGLRENNVTGLEWRNVDMARCVAWAHGDEMKNAKPLAVPLNANAMAILGQRKASNENPRYVFTYNGQPISKPNNSAWGKAIIRAGVPWCRWHDLRHTWASWHVMAGTPIGVLMELGGWSDLRMVLRYAHLSAGHVAEYAEKLKPMGRF